MEKWERPLGLNDGVILFDANYGRMGRIALEDAKCSGCGFQGVCIVVDQSEGEYHAGAICRECATKLTPQLPSGNCEK